MSADNWASCPKCSGSGTLREDYEFYYRDGFFRSKYRASCTECEFNYEHSARVPVAQLREAIGETPR